MSDSEDVKGRGEKIIKDFGGEGGVDSRRSGDGGREKEYEKKGTRQDVGYRSASRRG